MIFTTFQFLIFFLIVFPLLFAVPKSWRHPLLLAASYYFYMCSVPWYLTVIVAITLIDFIAGIRIEDTVSKRAKRHYLTLSILCNFGLLFVLKYAGFFASSINGVFGIGLPVLRFVLPLGISFHTFQAVSYTVEVYRRRVPAERDLLKYALYVAFFTQMVAGPIERPYNLLPQFHRDQVLTFDRFTSGLRMAIWGAFKKAVVADLLAPAVNTVYARPSQFSGPILILATFFFAIQIYCDFSGYSDIAVGIARMMGYDLMINFRQPYFAKSMGEFWHRWHISLSTWFRDYLYIPLGGSRVPVPRYCLNILIVFLVSGLWHGANWTFAIWGALHGLYLILGHLSAPGRDRLRAALGLNPAGRLLGGLQVITNFSLVTLAWVFFRAASVRDALSIVAHMLNWHGFRFTDLFSLGLPRFEMALSFLVIATVLATEWLMVNEPPLVSHLWSRRPFRWVCYYACVFGIVFFGVFNRIEFIYFQF
jgi:alginate O-acetyltransferase complex protein AlgI